MNFTSPPTCFNTPTICALNGARILRMHKVRESVRAAQMVEAVLGLREPAYLRHNLS